MGVGGEAVQAGQRRIRSPPAFPSRNHRLPLPPQVWRLLDARYDGLVGNCECMADRDMPDIGYTVHFSCMAVFSKPGHFHTDHDLQSTVYNRGKSCTRFYYMMWYRAYQSVMGLYPPPYYTGPPVPIWNVTHDEYVEWYRKHGKKGPEDE